MRIIHYAVNVIDVSRFFFFFSFFFQSDPDVSWKGECLNRGGAGCCFRHLFTNVLIFFLMNMQLFTKKKIQREAITCPVFLFFVCLFVCRF